MGGEIKWRLCSWKSWALLPNVKFLATNTQLATIRLPASSTNQPKIKPDKCLTACLDSKVDTQEHIPWKGGEKNIRKSTNSRWPVSGPEKKRKKNTVRPNESPAVTQTPLQSHTGRGRLSRTAVSEIEWHTPISNRPDRRILYKYLQAVGGLEEGERGGVTAVLVKLPNTRPIKKEERRNRRSRKRARINNEPANIFFL